MEVSTKETTMQILEWAEFGLKPDATEPALLTAANTMQAQFLSQQTGYISRKLVHLSANRYADVVVWASHAHADAAMAQAGQNAACAAYFSLMQLDAQPTMGQTLLSFGAEQSAASGT
jgi:hypothetical protein